MPVDKKDATHSIEKGFEDFCRLGSLHGLGYFTREAKLHTCER